MKIAKHQRIMFQSIRVGQGDAFFLNKFDKTALVDGGRSVMDFCKRFISSTGLTKVNICVCTHADADHSSGILGFLEELGADEVWLPGSWTDRLMDMLQKPDDFFEEIVEDVRNLVVSDNVDNVNISLQNIGDKKQENKYKLGTLEDKEIKDIRMDKLLTVIEDIYDRENVSLSFVSNPLSYVFHFPFPKYWANGIGSIHDRAKYSLLLEAFSTADRIRKIAIASFHSGAIIRWFDVNYQEVGGGIPSFLVPVNAREIVSISRRKLGALEYLALTQSNKDCLVFESPADDSFPGVLFSGDSDFSFPHKIAWAKGMLITAPHHGSESNSKAYQRVVSENPRCNDFVWVRSDSFRIRRPGNSYLNAPGRRYCTTCRCDPLLKQNVRLMAQKTWKPFFTKACNCQ
jgi:hypothetical protein